MVAGLTRFLYPLRIRNTTGAFIMKTALSRALRASAFGDCDGELPAEGSPREGQSYQDVKSDERGRETYLASGT